MWQHRLAQIRQGDRKVLARTISFVENEQDGFETLLADLPANPGIPVIGITGPPGAGKSTLADALIGLMVADGKKVAVLCVDPSSPFHLGALLGDRIRMSSWYTNDSVFIRSLATRGSMGGLHPHILEITELVKSAGFDYVIVETVGVGQSEIEIAGLADITMVVVVPEAGDEVQTMKAGLMEIADIFVVNKSDRPDADSFVKNLRTMLAPAFSNHRSEIPVIKTVAQEGTGVATLYEAIQTQGASPGIRDKRNWLLTERAYFLIQKERMRNVQKTELKKEIEALTGAGDFNIYRFVRKYYL